MTTYRFYKEPNHSWHSWYADIPGYPGPKGDLLMVAGADTLLDILAQGNDECSFLASETSFDGADKLELLNLSGGGGDYILREFQGKEIGHNLWLCNVITYVFGKVPDVLYFKPL